MYITLSPGSGIEAARGETVERRAVSIGAMSIGLKGSPTDERSRGMPRTSLPPNAGSRTGTAHPGGSDRLLLPGTGRSWLILDAETGMLICETRFRGWGDQVRKPDPRLPEGNSGEGRREWRGLRWFSRRG